jgi:DNA-3-methyladenine glycosylase
MANNSLKRSFFERQPDVVARDLIGVEIVVRSQERTLTARLVETEAYGGGDDPASHAFRGPTPRNQIMFGPAGFLYVYLSYGVHWCVNVVTGKSGSPCAVLLRAGELCIDPASSSHGDVAKIRLSGPGNLTRGLGIDGSDNGTDCCQTPRGRIGFQHGTESEDVLRIGQSSRIGLSKAVDRQSRYFLVGHAAVSGGKKRRGS